MEVVAEITHYTGRQIQLTHTYENTVVTVPVVESPTLSDPLTNTITTSYTDNVSNQILSAGIKVENDNSFIPDPSVDT